MLGGEKVYGGTNVYGGAHAGQRTPPPRISFLDPFEMNSPQE